MPRLTLLDVAKLDGNDTIVGLIEESLPVVPELSVFPVRQINGTSYTTVTRTGRPSVSFRSANEGVTATKSSFAQKLIECFILSARVEVDKAIIQAQKSEAASLEMLEAAGVMKQAMIEIAQQIWYGVSTDAKGFPGIKAFTPFSGAMTVNSGGSSSNVQSSVYGVKFGVQDVTLIMGNGQVFSLTDFRDETIYDAASAPLPGRVADLCGWVGMQIGNVNCVSRLANVGGPAETGDGVTDAKLQSLLDLHPVGYKPDAWFMSRRSNGGLQSARTVVINSGPGTAKAAGSIENIAMRPESSHGIPIFESDAILNTDAVES
jgi:hypothetical protein